LAHSFPQFQTVIQKRLQFGFNVKASATKLKHPVRSPAPRERLVPFQFA